MAATLTIVKLVILMGLSANFAYSALEWPESCANKYYCHQKPNNYPDEKWINSLILREDEIVSDNVTDRDGTTYAEDIALCKASTSFSPIYAIKDEYNVVWYVPQTDKFNITIELFECRNTSLLHGTQAPGLDGTAMKKKDVHCFEQRMSFKFLVLSQDLQKLETMSKSPYKGLPISCSAKVFKKK